MDEDKFLKDLAKLARASVEAERERCVAVCEGWLQRFGSGSIASDAVKDIRDLIRSGTHPAQR